VGTALVAAARMAPVAIGSAAHRRASAKPQTARRIPTAAPVNVVSFPVRFELAELEERATHGQTDRHEQRATDHPPPPTPERRPAPRRLPPPSPSPSPSPSSTHSLARSSSFEIAGQQHCHLRLNSADDGLEFRTKTAAASALPIRAVRAAACWTGIPYHYCIHYPAVQSLARLLARCRVLPDQHQSPRGMAACSHARSLARGAPGVGPVWSRRSVYMIMYSHRGPRAASRERRAPVCVPLTNEWAPAAVGVAGRGGQPF
jgi:hypothetical protein